MSWSQFISRCSSAIAFHDVRRQTITKYIYIQSPMAYLPIFSFVPRVTQRQTLLQISNSNWTEWSKILRLLHTMSIFRLRTADFLSESNRGKVFWDISLPRTSRYSVATSHVGKDACSRDSWQIVLLQRTLADKPRSFRRLVWIHRTLANKRKFFVGRQKIG